MINPFKWLVCWWYKRHVDARMVFQDDYTQMCVWRDKCVRCGRVADIK